MVELRAKPVISGPVRQSPLLKTNNDWSGEMCAFSVDFSRVRSLFKASILLMGIRFRISALFVSPVRYRLCRHEGGQVRVMSAASLTLNITFSCHQVVECWKDQRCQDVILHNPTYKSGQLRGYRT